MDFQITYSEQELCEVLKCHPRRIYDLRKMGILQGTKVGKGYVYHYKEIEEFFIKYRGKDVPKRY